MKGIFKIIDGEPFVLTKRGKETLELVNVKRCSTYNIGPKDYQYREIWNVIPFTDTKFWVKGSPVPSLYERQTIIVEQIKEKAKVVKLEH